MKVMDTYSWYQSLIKPSWAPPASVFGPVWTVLYILIAISFGTVFYKTATKKLPSRIILPFVLNLIFNFAFTPIQFGLKNNLLATLDILLVLGTLIWIFTFKKSFKKKGLEWIIYANVPYLLWVCFATTLQLTITYLNL